MTDTDTRKPADSDAPQPPVSRGHRAGDDDQCGTGPGTGESGGPKGLEPTRYGDWERNGRCTDF